MPQARSKQPRHQGFNRRVTHISEDPHAPLGGRNQPLTFLQHLECGHTVQKANEKIFRTATGARCPHCTVKEIIPQAAPEGAVTPEAEAQRYAAEKSHAAR